MAKAAKKSGSKGTKKGPAKKAAKKPVKLSGKTSTRTAKKKAKKKKKTVSRAKKATPNEIPNAFETIAIARSRTPARPQTKCRKIDGECIMFGLSPTGYDIPMGKVDCSKCESFF